MNTLLNNYEKQDLRVMLENPLLKKSFVEALNSTYREKAGATSLEQAAMAYNFTEGARGILNRLLSMADIKEEISATTNTRKFRPTID
jgi:hypothetical protein